MIKMHDQRELPEEPRKWKLETRSDGYDEILYGTYEECLRDVLHYHEMEELPEHWELIPVDWEIEE